MKKIAMILLFLSSTVVVCQEEPTASKEIVFYDKCTKKNLKIPYIYKSPSPYVYTVKYTIRRGEWESENTMISSGKEIDSIIIDKITRFTHSKNPNKELYLNCNQVSQGNLKEYYLNGVLEFEGTFHQGIPKEMKNYYPNGNLSFHSIVVNDSIVNKKTFQYDIAGTIMFARTYLKKGNKVLVKEYDLNGKLIYEGEEKTYIEE